MESSCALTVPAHAVVLIRRKTRKRFDPNLISIPLAGALLAHNGKFEVAAVPEQRPHPSSEQNGRDSKDVQL